MKMFVNVFIFVCFFISCSLYPFSYDSAALLAQQGEWKNAHEKLNTILINSPDRADVVYDAGVAAYNLESFSQAAACFLRAAECSDEAVLRARAYFNAGNALVSDKKLEEALEQYENALTIDPHHEYAKHNYDRVKQMLEDQEKNQQQDKQKQCDNPNQENEQDEQDQEEQQDKQDTQDQQNQQDQQSGGKDTQQDKNKKNDQKNKNDGGQDEPSDKSSSKDKSDQQTQGEQADEAQGGGNNAQRKEQRNKEKKQEQSQENQKRDGNQELQEKSHDKKNKENIKQGNQHEKAPEEESKGSDDASVPSEGDQDQGKADSCSVAGALEDLQRDFEKKINDPWLLDVLRNQEEADKAVNKQLMEAKIHQHGGKHGQNCW